MKGPKPVLACVGEVQRLRVNLCLLAGNPEYFDFIINNNKIATNL